MTTNCKTTPLGKEYMGTLAVANGTTCQRWDSQTPHSHQNNNNVNFPDANLTDAANYCRNPDNEEGGLWCYTINPQIRWSYCEVKFCPTGKFHFLAFISMWRYDTFSCFYNVITVMPKGWCHRVYNQPSVFFIPSYIRPNPVSGCILKMRSLNCISAKSLMSVQHK